MVDDPSNTAEEAVRKRKRLRALLDGVDLDPTQTADDVAPQDNRDAELMNDVPPHHVDR